MTRRVIITLTLAIAIATPFRSQAQSVRGRVFDRDAGTPIANAEVSLPTLGRQTITNDRGEFRLGELTPGGHELRARHLGYREMTVAVSVPLRGEVEREILLSRVQTLDTIAVSASAVIPSFEEHRRIGLGKFLTRAELEKQENRKLAEVLEQVGARALRNGHRAWIGGSGGRGQRSFMNRGDQKCSLLEGVEAPRGSERSARENPGCGCFSLVYVNNALVYNGEEGRLVPDVNMIPPSSLEAVEYYKGPGQIPIKYSGLNTECGVLVLHTRRVPK